MECAEDHIRLVLYIVNQISLCEVHLVIISIILSVELAARSLHIIQGSLKQMNQIISVTEVQTLIFDLKDLQSVRNYIFINSPSFLRLKIKWIHPFSAAYPLQGRGGAWSLPQLS